jgi:hypothetical protein
MELLDRYLQAVKKYLPWNRQDDIVAELRANLESQLEDKEAELGRPLTTSEAEAWLRQLGSPMQVAVRYQPQQYLIGPAIFPAYWYVLRLALGWTLAIYAIVSAISIATGNLNGQAVLDAVLHIPGVLITTAAWVTVIFAALELGGNCGAFKLPALPIPFADWDPAKLPPLDAQVAGGKKPRTYAQAVAEVIFGFLVLVWLLLVRNHPAVMFGPGAAYFETTPYQLAPVWLEFYWWIIALNAVQLVWRSIDLLRGGWQHPARMQHIVVKAMGLTPLVLLLTTPGHILLTLKNPALDQARYGDALVSINKGVYTGFAVVAAIASVQLIADLWTASSEARRQREARR